ILDVLDGFFFSSRRRHTRLQGDWSSDVCSSDLATLGALAAGLLPLGAAGAGAASDNAGGLCRSSFGDRGPTGGPIVGEAPPGDQIGRASCRESAQRPVAAAPVHKKTQ